MPNDPMLAKALAVLAKADSTPFEEERSALVYGGYVLLARYLASNPVPAASDGRRRERRLVADRRRRAKRGQDPSRRDAGAAYGSGGGPNGSGTGGLLDAAI